MTKYMIEWFPERKIKNVTLTAKNNKKLFAVGLLFAIFSISIGFLPFFGIGTIGFGTWFNISINTILLCWYGFMCFRVKKNDIGNGVPRKW